MKPWDNKKIALVTGASRGIGAAIALGLAKNDIHVVLIARTSGALEDLDDQIKNAGGSATLLPMDLSKLHDVDKIGPTIVERFGRLDILIGNAGTLGTTGPVGHIRPKEWEQVMALNFHSNVRLVRTLDPILRQSRQGRIVFTTSHLAQTPQAYFGPYAASKAALDAFIKTYAAETQNTNLRINAVAPGAVDTKLLQGAFPGGTPFRAKQPEEVVPAYLDLIQDDVDRHGDIVYLD